ncbi:MAG TPA: ankyrin repeat domain-containing protein [Methylocella sp.]|jgi:ankyrin repeat protein
MMAKQPENEDELSIVGGTKKGLSPARQEEIQAEFLAAANDGNDPVLYHALAFGADINKPDKRTGLTALHLAIGRNAFDAVKLLVLRGAAFVPDNLGRMPSVIAAECEVSEELCDFVVEAEAAAEATAEGV